MSPHLCSASSMLQCAKLPTLSPKRTSEEFRQQNKMQFDWNTTFSCT
jgi:hypothetical protein